MKTNRKDLVATVFVLSLLRYYLLTAHQKCIPAERLVKTIEIVKVRVKDCICYKMIRILFDTK